MNRVIHFEIPFENSERVQKFYREIFGWKINKVPEMEYHFAITTDTDMNTMKPKQPGGINGGLLKKDPTGKHPMIVIEVESIDKHLKQIQSLGGKTLMPKTTIGGFGFYARFSDSEGNVIGLWQTVKP